MLIKTNAVVNGSSMPIVLSNDEVTSGVMIIQIKENKLEFSIEFLKKLLGYLEENEDEDVEMDL